MWRLLKWFLFRFDAETAHLITSFLIRIGIHSGCVPLRIASGASSRDKLAESDMPEVFGIRFRSRLGLAAGFDKNADLLAGLPALGFGFAEIGTVTPRSQPGNDRPRLFRDPAREALFNRMGFNSLGAAIASDALRKAREGLPFGFRVGVNVGKNKDTPLKDAPSDYAQASGYFEGLADYMVINVSSPNTPGLRSLQTEEALKPIIDAVNEVISAWNRRPPLLLKLAPEIVGDDLARLLSALERQGIDGWVLTNTLGGEYRGQPGGWSGGPLTEVSRLRLSEARSASRLPIISVGGILSCEEASTRVKLGADLVQVYTGWIFKGPSFPREISQFLCKHNP